MAIRDERRLSYHPELAAGVDFPSRVQTLQVWMMFSHCSAPADPALAMGTRVAAAERGLGRGQRAGAMPDLELASLRCHGMWILNHVVGLKWNNVMPGCPGALILHLGFEQALTILVGE